MHFRAALLVVLCPLLTNSQLRKLTEVQLLGSGSNGVFVEEGQAPSMKSAPSQCAQARAMPQTFSAKRKFWSFRNHIDFYDTNGRPLGFVKSWFIDLKNPFGFSGASFYLPPIPLIGASQEIRLSGSMTSPDFKDAFADRMEIQDCQGAERFKVADGVLFNTVMGPVTLGGSPTQTVRDATYVAKRTNSENQLIIQSLSFPHRNLVELTMKNPCRPFAPFCAGMGLGGWFIYGDEWQGGFINQPSAGAATDMDLLALYSSFQFSNTRWSPPMFIALNILMLLCCICCIRRCCCTRSANKTEMAHFTSEEADALVTKVAEDTREEPKPAPGSTSIFTCCARRGRTILPADAPTH